MHDAAGGIEHLERDRSGWLSAEVVVERHAGVRSRDSLRRLEQPRRGRGCRRVDLPQRRDVVERPDRSSLRRGDQVVAANVEVVDGDARHVQLQRAPTARRRRTTRRPRSPCRRRPTRAAPDRRSTPSPARRRSDGGDCRRLHGALVRRQARDLGDGQVMRRTSTWRPVQTDGDAAAPRFARCGADSRDRPIDADLRSRPRSAARSIDVHVSPPSIVFHVPPLGVVIDVDAGLAGDALDRRDRPAVERTRAPPGQIGIERRRDRRSSPARRHAGCRSRRRRATIAVPTRASLRMPAAMTTADLPVRRPPAPAARTCTTPARSTPSA